MNVFKDMKEGLVEANKKVEPLKAKTEGGPKNRQVNQSTVCQKEGEVVGKLMWERRSI